MSQENYTRLESLLFQLSHHLRPKAVREGLSVPQFMILRRLAAQGPTTVSGLAQWIGVSKSAVTQLTQKLETQAWVSRSRDPTNQRQVWVTITQSGQGRVNAVRALQINIVRQAVAELSAEEQATIETLLAKLVASSAFDNVHGVDEKACVSPKSP